MSSHRTGHTFLILSVMPNQLVAEHTFLPNFPSGLRFETLCKDDGASFMLQKCSSGDHANFFSRTSIVTLLGLSMASPSALDQMPCEKRRNAVNLDLYEPFPETSRLERAPRGVPDSAHQQLSLLSCMHEYILIPSNLGRGRLLPAPYLHCSTRNATNYRCCGASSFRPAH
jgi:hypothetical protein